MRVRLKVDLFSPIIGTHIRSGRIFVVGNKIPAGSLSCCKEDCYSLWDEKRLKIVVPYAREDWFEDITD